MPLVYIPIFRPSSRGRVLGIAESIRASISEALHVSSIERTSLGPSALCRGGNLCEVACVNRLDRPHAKNTGW